MITDHARQLAVLLMVPLSLPLIRRRERTVQECLALLALLATGVLWVVYGPLANAGSLEVQFLATRPSRSLRGAARPRDRRPPCPRDRGAHMAGGYRAVPVILSDPVRSYLDALRTAPDAVLAEMEAHADREHVPVVEPPTGELLHALALASRARRIVEVGTAIGVSTLYLARALPPDGRIVSFEIDERRHASAQNYLERAGVGDRADLRLQDARAGLESLSAGGFDLAFVDGVKVQYDDYVEALLPLLRPGGVLAVDNVLMGGTVAEGRSDGSWTEDQIAFAQAFNQRLVEDPRVAATVTPIGDGVLIAVKL